MLLTLYSGENCCLCEQAESMLAQLPEQKYALKKVDVKTDPNLYHLYGARIPVFYRPDNQQELPWPFEVSQLDEFLR